MNKASIKNFNAKELAGLDSLRFFCFLLVFNYHYFGHVETGGGEIFNLFKNIFTLLGLSGVIGVQVFFVLSGFLITFLSAKSISKKSFSILTFYKKRILRIWPLYYLVAAISIVTLLCCGVNPVSGIYWSILFFFSNLDVYYHMRIPPSILGAQWSVCVEEQFYLIWPWILLLRFRMAVLLVLYLFSLYFSLYNTNPYSYFHLIFAFKALITGGISALIVIRVLENESLVSKVDSFIFKMRNQLPFIFIIIVFLVLILLKHFSMKYFSVGFRFKNVNFLSDFMLLWLYALLIILLPVFSKCRKQITETIGKFSYGMYMIHMLIITLFKIVLEKLFHQTITSIPTFIAGYFICLLITLQVSRISYSYFESIFLRIKNNLDK